MSNLVTQSSLIEIDAALSGLGSVLSAHAGSSLATAHSVTALYFPAPVYNSSGNNVQYYSDSAGDIVGQYQLRFTVNDTVYYAPAKTTALAGQTSTVTNTLLSNTAISALLSEREPTALTTAFAENSVAYTDEVRDALLIPHTRLGHWEAHAPITVRSRVIYDSRGNVVGRFAATFQFNGVKYDIPCDTDLGGPPKLWNWVGLGLAADVNFTSSSASGFQDNQVARPLYYRDGFGTLPRTVSLQVTDVDMTQINPPTPVWRDVPLAGATYTSGAGWTRDNLTVAAYTSPTYPANASLPATASFVTLTGFPGSNDLRFICSARAKVISDVGGGNLVAYSNICTFKAGDQDG